MCKTSKRNINSSACVLLETKFSFSDIPSSKDKFHFSNRYQTGIIFPVLFVFSQMNFFPLPSLLTSFLTFWGSHQGSRSWFSDFSSVLGPGFVVFLGSHWSPGSQISSFLGSYQGLGSQFSVFLGFHQGFGFSVFLGSHQSHRSQFSGFSVVLLGSWFSFFLRSHQGFRSQFSGKPLVFFKQILDRNNFPSCVCVQ